jgi:hypothetical protein
MTFEYSKHEFNLDNLLLWVLLNEGLCLESVLKVDIFDLVANVAASVFEVNLDYNFFWIQMGEIIRRFETECMYLYWLTELHLNKPLIIHTFREEFGLILVQQLLCLMDCPVLRHYKLMVTDL